MKVKNYGECELKEVKKSIYEIYDEFITEYGYNEDYIGNIIFGETIVLDPYIKRKKEWAEFCTLGFINETMKLKKIELDFLRKYHDEHLWVEFKKYVFDLAYSQLGEEPRYE